MSLDIQYISIDHSQFQGSKNSKLKTAARISRTHAPFTKAALPSLLLLSAISRVGDLCVLRFYLCIYRYGSSLSVYSTLRRTLAADLQIIS